MITQHWKYKGLFLLTICILIVSFMALSLPLVSCTPAVTEVEKAALPEEATTFESIIITGIGDKASQPFRVTTKEWIVNWSYVPYPEYPQLAVFSFFIYPRGETVIFVELMLVPEGTSGSTYSYAGAGEYYIKVIADNVKSWEIVISPP